MIKLLNDKFSLGLSTERMEEYAVKLGQTVLFSFGTNLFSLPE